MFQGIFSMWSNNWYLRYSFIWG